MAAIERDLLVDGEFFEIGDQVDASQAASGGRGERQVRGGHVGVEVPAEGDGGSPPRSWAATKPGPTTGAMPAKVSVRVRPIVTAGFAKLVDDVNQ